jgi:HD-GYP domain-containing protein (c-di-GMP phosphodiesterase class II)/DNA-binding CsgD family transcriptional regulator
MAVSSTSPQPFPGCLRTVDLISALSAAADLTLGLPAEHAARSCYIALAIASELRLSDERRSELYYTTLLLDAGCTAWASMFAAYVNGNEVTARQELFFNRDPQDSLEVFDWVRRYLAAGSPLPLRAGRILDFVVHGQEHFREGFHNTCEVSNRFARRLGMPEPVQHALLYVFEHWNGRGLPHAIRGEAIPIIARIAHAAMFLEIFHRRDGRDGVIRLAQARKGKEFDPSVIDAFLAASGRPVFWEDLEQASVLDIVRSLEPPLPIRFMPEEKLLDVALFAADFADMKSRYTIGHSRRVATLAAGIARLLSLPEPEIETVRLAALFHDLGLVAIPSFVLDKPRVALTQAEREALRLHPYHAERILGRVPGLEAVAAIVGAHHERMDGDGYYRRLAGTHVPLGARIVAVADAFDDLTHEGPGRPPLDADAAVEQMRAEVGRRFYPDVFAAFLQEDAVAPRLANKDLPRLTWPAGLTAREVDVLRLAAKGLTRKQMAGALYVSESTIRAHLEHIYDKIGVSTRAAATLFAVEHDLVA